MKKNTKIIILLALITVLSTALVITANAVGGAAFTTFNPSVDGSSKDVCKNSIINCNIYGAKEYVWLNGGPDANHLKPDGEYFFAVLEPGGQPNPNDQGGVPDKNLSDDFDDYTNRQFTITDGEVSVYAGDHWLDSNTQAPDGCKNGNGPQACDGPDDLPPYIRLFPYSDTTNPGGVYILAICSLEDGYPVEPRDCKYDAFKVKEGRVTYQFMLEGYKFHDLDADGAWEAEEPGLPDWEITISGTGYLGEDIDVTLTTGEGGYWFYESELYTFTGSAKPQAAELTICEVLQDGWVQSFPADPECYDVTVDPSGVGFVGELNFGNYMPVDITVCKEIGNHNDSTTILFEGWEVYLYRDGELFDTQLTGEDGCYTWEDLMPGYTYTVGEYDPLEWVPAGEAFVDFGFVLSGDGPFSHTFVNYPAQGCTPGFWGGGSDDGQAGGQWLWNNVEDLNWQLVGGQGWNPYIWTTSFNEYFTPVASLGGWDMHSLVNTGGGSLDAQKAARSMTAAYLNASFGIYYAYSIDELLDMWDAAVADGSDAAFLSLHTLLDAANNHFGNPDGDCPISAGNAEINQ
ncbi:MAG TPA: hypothetical protein VLA32_11500 [Anaerolineales bacterium]|jgi:hypothetical protein|nr:hypothetical protein [Anaerolineales bacterium]